MSIVIIFGKHDQVVTVCVVTKLIRKLNEDCHDNDGYREVPAFQFNVKDFSLSFIA